MAPASCPSSGSWSGRCARPQDILDLDRYMRGGVRPSPSQHRKCQELVVDAGGLRKPYDVVRATATSSEVSLPQNKTKRFSHDSGLSDDTYKKHKHRTHKRPYNPQAGHSRQKVWNAFPERGSHRSTDSMRTFRKACEKALLQQQEQLARVAQICEKLTANVEPNTKAEEDDKIKSRDQLQVASQPIVQAQVQQTKHKGDYQASVQPVHIKKKEQRNQSTAETSEITSSSRSTVGNKKKPNYRTDECKTYKIIMSKLDELNRLFVVRGRPTQRPQVPLPYTSGDNVTVCDKVVATDFSPRVITARRLTPTMQRNKPITPRILVERGVGSEVSTNQLASIRGSNRASVRESNRSSLRGNSTKTNNLYPIGNLPFKVSECDNVGHARSTPKGNSVRNEFVSKSYINRQFDLNDPIKFYTQGKNMHTMYGTTHYRRGRSHSVGDSAQSSRLADRAARVSLCALCRGYWQTFRGFLCCPDYTLMGFNR